MISITDLHIYTKWDNLFEKFKVVVIAQMGGFPLTVRVNRVREMDWMPDYVTLPEFSSNSPLTPLSIPTVLSSTATAAVEE